MAEELTNEVKETEELPHGETEESETNWKAEARKWERYAKKAQALEAELEQMKQAQMTEQEKERARADAAEAELASLRAEHERTSAAQRIASESGIPLDLLLYCKDEEAMTEFAAVYAKETHVNAAPSANGSTRIVRSESKGISNGEMFAEIAEQMMKR